MLLHPYREQFTHAWYLQNWKYMYFDCYEVTSSIQIWTGKKMFYLFSDCEIMRTTVDSFERAQWWLFGLLHHVG